MKSPSRLHRLTSMAILMIVIGSGCVPQPRAVKVDAPRLALALMFVGVCAVLCSSIGGFSLVRAAKHRKEP